MPSVTPRRRRATLLLVGVTLVLLAACQGPGTARRRHASLEHSVMVGYQGWFRTPADGAGLGWTHYAGGNRGAFGPGHVVIDYWPDVSELPPDARAPTAFRYPDGRPAEVYSAQHPAVTDLHFRWMRGYGIDGAFVQRFSAPIIGDDVMAQRRLRSSDVVLQHAMAAAEKYDRSLVVMYDLSGMPAGAMRQVEADWKHLVDDLHVRESPAYQFHRGRPLVAVWGIGFDDGRAYTLGECAELVRFLKDDPVYGHNTVMLGVPTWWREQTADTVTDPDLHRVLQLADIVSPWTPGRYADLGAVQAHAERFWIPDRAWCTAHHLDYLPVVFPGFSWRNLKGGHGDIDRLDGRFLWEQYRQLTNHGFTMVYQAMFDEMDEGTQIFKTALAPPPGAYFATYAPLPSDYYLWLVGSAANHVRSGTPLTRAIGDYPRSAAVTAYLRRGDPAIYAAQPGQYDAHRRFFQIADSLAAARPAPAALDGGTKQVSATGRWHWNYLWCSEATGTVTWDLAVPRTGTWHVQVRYPGDPNQDHATDARLRVVQDGVTVAEHRLNLRTNTLTWGDLGTVSLKSGAPAHLVLDEEKDTGRLTLFEPRLVATP